MINHLYFRNRRQYQLDRLWESIDKTNAKQEAINNGFKEVTEYQIWDFSGKVCVFLDKEKAENWVNRGGLFHGKPVYSIITRNFLVKAI